MPITTVRVSGTVRDMNGSPYEGAIVEVYLNSQISYSNSLVGNEVHRTYTDAYGRFDFDLIPTTLSNVSENHYVFKVIKDTVNIYKKTLGTGSSDLDFESLPDYVPPGQRTQFIGDSPSYGPNLIIAPTSYSGIYQWKTFDSDGTSKIFSTPTGSVVYIVSLNGVLQSPNVDYFKRSDNVIEFYSTPLSGDLVAIQYQIA